jgi:hypothetical protein
MADNNAALFHPSWDLLCQIQVWPGIIKLQCCSCISSSVICFSTILCYISAAAFTVLIGDISNYISSKKLVHELGIS